MFDTLTQFESLESRQLLSSGQLDPTFGENGLTILPHIVDSEYMTTLAVQSDGKILAAGNHYGFRLARFLPNGSLDTSFGVDGFADFGYAASSSLSTIRIQPDGKIVVAGNDTWNGDQICGNGDIFVARLHPDGTFDSSFSGDGKVKANF